MRAVRVCLRFPRGLRGAAGSRGATGLGPVRHCLKLREWRGESLKMKGMGGATAARPAVTAVRSSPLTARTLTPASRMTSRRQGGGSDASPASSHRPVMLWHAGCSGEVSRRPSRLRDR